MFGAFEEPSYFFPLQIYSLFFPVLVLVDVIRSSVPLLVM